VSIIHVLDRQTDAILGTLSLKNADYWSDTRKDSLNNENTFDFIANATQAKSSLLEKRNRLLIQDEDGYFQEYIIVYAEQYKRNEKDVRSNASFTDLAKAKVIEPQVLTGATSTTATTLALEGTEWTPGTIIFAGTQTINIENYTNPLALLKTIATTFDMEIRFRVEIDGNQIAGRYVDMVRKVAGFEGKEIRFGKDLVGVKRKEDSNQILTALLGIGPEKEDGTRLTVLVKSDEAFQRWGRNGKHLIEPYEPESSDEEMTLERLQTLTENELEKRIDAIVSYECQAISLEHIFGREHEQIRVGQTIRIKDDGYQPPLYVEGRIQEVEVEQSTHRINSFMIGNFIEYKKEELEKQVALLKQLITQKASKKYADAKAAAAIQSAATYTQDYSEKKKVLSANAPSDVSVIWIKPEPATNVNIAHAHDGNDWVPLTTTNASDIIEGEMLFDRLRGGKLVLGGTNNTNGVLEVYNSAGEKVIDIDADNGGFDDLYVGSFRSPSVPNYNKDTINYYVDPAGDDENDGLSWSSPKKTIQSCIDLIPKFNDGGVYITLKAPPSGRQDYWGSIMIEGFVGGGTIQIQGQNWNNYINGRVFVRGCTNNIYFYNLTINLTDSSTAGLTVYTSTYVYCEKLWVYGQGTAMAFFALNGSNLQLTMCEAYDCSYAVQASYLANIYVDRCKGYGTARGLVAQWGAWIYVYSTYPTGATSATYNDSAGGISLNGAVANAGAKGTTPVQQYSKQWSTTTGHNWGTLYGWENNLMRQGNYGYGERTGYFEFGTNISSILAGKTIKSMRVWVQRKSQGGASAKTPIYIRYHNYTTKPGGQPVMSSAYARIDLAWGEGGWVTVPVAFLNAFSNGSAKGIGLWANSANSQYYSNMVMDCWVEATYQ
jgi:phage minor structural protein